MANAADVGGGVSTSDRNAKCSKVFINNWIFGVSVVAHRLMDTETGDSGVKNQFKTWLHQFERKVVVKVILMAQNYLKDASVGAC